MKNLFVLAGAAWLLGCGGGGGNAANPPMPGDPQDPGGFGRYPTSYPLPDNTGATTYRVLLIGNSHVGNLYPALTQLLNLGQPDKTIDVQLSPGFGFLVDRVGDGVTAPALESQPWTQVILQGQMYSTTGTNSYPTDAAEYWIRGTKQQGATSIMFPEHPRRGNTWEGRTLWELHSGIALRENTCVAPVGLVWDEVIFRAPHLILHDPDGNHASKLGAQLSALVFYPIITGEPVESLPNLSSIGIDAATEEIMKQSVSSILFTHQACRYGE